MLKKKRIPHTYVIVFYIIVIAAICTWFVPGGEFQREQKILPDGSSKTVIVPGSFHYIDSEPQTWQIFSSIFDGFVDKADIIALILLIGGAFWIMNASKAIDIAILSFLEFTKKLENVKLIKAIGVNNIVLTLIMLMFSLLGAVFGMSEETIAFVIIFVPLAISMGYDSIVGVSLCFVAAGLGFAGAMLNPFTIGIAQGLSDVPLFSGLEYRFICWIIINFIGIGWILRYASKIKKNPKKSLVYEEDKYWRDKAAEGIGESSSRASIATWVTFIGILTVMVIYSFTHTWTVLSVGGADSSLNWPIIPVLTVLFAFGGIMALRKSAQFFVLHILIFTIFYLIIGVMGYQWYIMEISTLFLVMGLASGIAMNYNPNKIVKLFIDGASDILSAAFVVGLAGGIIIILQNGKIIDSMLYSVAESMNNLGKFGSITVMYGIQNLINVFIPSGSAKAALTMPIMAPFSDLIGISRQATIMAFQFGDGFTNMITPTSGILIGVLGVAKIPYEKWVKWITPFMIILILLGLLLLIPTVTMNLNGF